MAEIKLRVERGAGKLLLVMDRNKGGNPNLPQRVAGCPPTYKDLEIGKGNADRWQREASV